MASRSKSMRRSATATGAAPSSDVWNGTFSGGTGGTGGTGGSGGLSGIGILLAGTSLGSVTGIDFEGSGVTAAVAGSTSTVTVSGGGGGGIPARSDQATLGNSTADFAAAFLTETRREGQFTFYSAARCLAQTGISLPALVAADPQQAIAIPKQSDPTGASGAFVRKWNWELGLDVSWFGALLDDETDDHVAVLAARDLSFTLAKNPGSNPYYKVGPAVVVSGTAYIAANSYDMKHTHELRGINTSGLQGFNYPAHLRILAGSMS